MKEILSNIDEYIDCGDFKAIDKELDKMFSEYKISECSKTLAFYINSKFTHYKAGFYAKFMEQVIRKKRKIAMHDFPSNDLFKLCIARGSRDLYECYIEEGIEAYIEKNKNISAEDIYTDLYAEATDINDVLYEKYAQCLKGVDYNGAFSRHENNPNIELINSDDYKTMEGVMELYNSIVGRRDIIKNLDKKCYEDDID